MYSFASGTILSAGTCAPSIPGTQPVSSNISLASFRRAIQSLGIALLMSDDEADPPPTKWSDLRYVSEIKEDSNDKEALQARRDRREAAPSGCSSLAGPRHDGGDPADRCERGDLLSLATRVWRAEDRAGQAPEGA